MLRYAITNGLLVASPHGSQGLDGSPAAREDFAEVARRVRVLAAQGVSFVLLREPALGAGELLRLARDVVAGAGGTRVLLPGRVDVALAAGAAGVHLRAATGELRPAQVRRLMPSAFVSVSCHTAEQVLRAREGDASAILFAPVFGKQVAGREVVAGAGLQRLREACSLAGPVPVFALGGVTGANAAACVEAGAAGVAGIRMFFPEGTVQAESPAR